jgi:hypothetical protein
MYVPEGATNEDPPLPLTKDLDETQRRQAEELK